MRTRIQRFRSVGYDVAALAIVGGLMVACGDDDPAYEAAPTTQSVLTTAETPATSEEPAATTTTTEPAPEYAELIVDYCEGFGRLDEPGGVDELIGMMTEDIVLTDTVLGGALTGTEMVRDYLTSAAFAGIDTALCGTAVERGGWYAGSYSLGSSEIGAGAVGMTVMHVGDGKIDRHVSYYTPDEVLDSPLTLLGTPGEIADRLHARTNRPARQRRSVGGSSHNHGTIRSPTKP